MDRLIAGRAPRRDWSRVAAAGVHAERLEPDWWRDAQSADEQWARRLLHTRGWLADELPAGELRAAVAPLLEMRAALVLLEVRSSEHRLESGRTPSGEQLTITVARRRLRDGSARRAWAADLAVDRAAGQLATAGAVPLDADPSRCPAPLDVGELEQWLGRAGLVRAELERLPRWLARLGRSREAPAGRRGKVAPTERADVGVRLVLRALADTIVANLPGTAAALDSEFLHDFRVAVRRSRSVLGRMRRVLPERSRARFRRELRWLGQLSGPARDLDVYLLGLDERCAELAGAARAGIGPLRRRLELQRAASHERLARALCSRRTRRLLGDWEAFLDRRPAGRPIAPRARAPIAEVAAGEIRRAWRLAIGQGRRIDDSSSASELHELRKSCKKLRYLLELFGGLVDPEATRALVGPLKGVQRVLGEVQDLEVESTLLADLAHALDRTPKSTPAARETLRAIEEELEPRRQSARAGFAEAFAALADPAHDAWVRARFGKPGRPTRDEG
jgi:CHAD domain-containing protein